MISIIIPTKDEEKYIKKTLKQFLPFKRKYKLELIVSDGCSKDDTVKIAKKYADRVVLYNKKRKQRISEGRNAGAKSAKGEILIFIDADIRIINLKGFVEAINKKFENQDVVAATVPNSVYPEEEIFSDKIFHFIFNSTIHLSNLLGIGGGRGECQIIRKSIFEDIGGYDRKLVAAEDVELYERLRKKGKIAYFKGVKVYESPRRFRKSGYFRTFFIYVINFIFMKFFKRSFSKEWKEVR